MIVFVGDTHGEFAFLPKILKNVPEDATIIQVGDFGFYPGHYEREWNRVWKSMDRKTPMYFIDGNHEYHPNLSHDKPKEVWQGLIHLPRASRMEIDGKNIVFFGGAFSPDRIFRVLGRDYFSSEVPSQEQFQKLLDIDVKVDLFVTHTAPQSVVDAWFPHPSIFKDWELPRDWFDPTARMVEKAWNKFGKPPMVCGHFHKTIISYPGPVRLLDINEIYEWRMTDEHF